MPTDVVMPQMGESIAEGTIVRWIKKVGDTVERDEPLFEISTDKVDAEIPSPAAGVVTEIRVKEGETVPVNSVVAVIGAGGRSRAAPARRGCRRAAAAASAPPAADALRRRDAGAAAAGDAADGRRRRRSAARRSRRRSRAVAAGRSARAAGRVDRGRDSRSGRRRWCARSRRSTTSTSRRFTAPASPAA